MQNYTLTLLQNATKALKSINRGKIRLAARHNKKIPEGVALDNKGKPTTDPRTAQMNPD